MHLGEVIKDYRAENGLSMQAFADKCKLSKGYIAMLERNVNSKTGEPVVPSIETLVKVSGAMNMSLSALLSVVDENQPVLLEDNRKTAEIDLTMSKILELSAAAGAAGHPVPILGTMCAGNSEISEENFDGYFFIDDSIKADFCLNVRGDSMTESQIHGGDKALIKKTDDYRNGKIYAVMVNDGTEAMLKHVFWYADHIILNSSNPDYEPIVAQPENVSVIGELVGVYHPAD